MKTLLALVLLVLPALNADAGWHKTKSVMKPVNQSVADSTTFQWDDTMYASLPGGTTWFVMWDMHVFSASTVPDMKIRVAEPATLSTITLACKEFDGPTAALTGTDYHGFLQEIVLDLAANTDHYISCRGILEVHLNNSGQYGVQWAQNTSNATPVTVKRGSYFRIERADTNGS